MCFYRIYPLHSTQLSRSTHTMSATQSPAFSRLNQEMAGKKPKATTQLKTDEYAPTAPRDAVQNVMVYHFYR